MGSHTKSVLHSAGVPTMGIGPFLTTGRVFFVDSNHDFAADSRERNGTIDAPFATIDYAIGCCTANKGDTILVAPGHVETITASAGLACDVAGVTIIGLGLGDSRPQINVTTATTADIEVTAANVTMVNLRFTGGVDAIAGMIDVSGDNFSLLDCLFEDVTGQVTDFLIATGCDRLLIDGLEYRGAAAAGTNAAIALATTTKACIRNCIFDGNFAVGVIDCRTGASSDLDVYNIRARTRNAADIFLVDTITGSTGTIGPDIFIRLNDNAANITEAITGATFVLHQKISVVNAAGEVGMEINTTASLDA